MMPAPFSRGLVAAALAAAAILVAAGSRPSAAADEDLTPAIPFSFGASRFSMRLPLGFKLRDEANPEPGYWYFGFGSPPREDNTSAVVQVAFLDLSRAGRPVPLSEFAKTQTGSMTPTYKGWKSTETLIQIDGVPAKRVQWTGTLSAPDGRTFAMHGVMILGIKEGIGFRLEAFDSEGPRQSEVPRGERALRTFAVTIGR